MCLGPLGHCAGPPPTRPPLCPAHTGRSNGLIGDADRPFWGRNGHDVAFVLRALGVHGAVGCGHSSGGHAIAHAAALAPGLFKRVLLLDPIIFGAPLYEQYQGGYPEGSDRARMVRGTRRRKDGFPGGAAACPSVICPSVHRCAGAGRALVRSCVEAALRLPFRACPQAPCWQQAAADP